MTAAGFRYDIDGELLTEGEVLAIAKAHSLARATVRTRLHHGDRTWARLLRAPDKRPARKHAFNRRPRG